MSEVNSNEENKPKKTDECIELKNIKYQTMLINNNMDLNRKKETTNLANIDQFLRPTRLSCLVLNLSNVLHTCLFQV